MIQVDYFFGDFHIDNMPLILNRAFILSIKF
jgi:hypothetical protein